MTVSNVFVNAGNVLQIFEHTAAGLTYLDELASVDPTSADTPTTLTQTRYRGGFTDLTSGDIWAAQEPVSPPATAKGFGTYYAGGVDAGKVANWGTGQLDRSTSAPIDAATVGFVVYDSVGWSGGFGPTVYMGLTQAQTIYGGSGSTYSSLVEVDPVNGDYRLHHSAFNATSAVLSRIKNTLPCWDQASQQLFYVRGDAGHDYEVWCYNLTTFTDTFVADAASTGDADFFPDSLGGHLDADGNIVTMGNSGHIAIIGTDGSLVYKMTTPGTQVYEQLYSFNDTAEATLTPAFADAYELFTANHACVSPDGLDLLILAEAHDVSGAVPTATYGAARPRAGLVDGAIWRWNIADRYLVNETPTLLPGFTSGMASSPVPARAQAIWTLGGTGSTTWPLHVVAADGTSYRVGPDSNPDGGLMRMVEADGTRWVQSPSGAPMAVVGPDGTVLTTLPMIAE